MRLLTAAGLAAVMMTLAAPRRAGAATAEEVRKALERAKQYLYDSAQSSPQAVADAATQAAAARAAAATRPATGPTAAPAAPARDYWEVVPAPDKNDKDPQSHVQYWQWGGVSACAVYGLLAGGEDPKDPRLAPAIGWLASQTFHGHYAIAMRCQMYPYLNDAAKYRGWTRRAMIERDLHTLLAAPYYAGQYTGFYPYYTLEGGKPQPGWHDLSVSQIAVLGVWSCAECGANVPETYWKMVDESWKRAQHADGGWPYRVDQGDARAPMTAAGVATLNITQNHLTQMNGFATCKGTGRNLYIEAGMKWLDQNINSLLTRGNYGLYGMYGLERIGVASGRKYFGTVDWGAVGADYLVRSQNADGSFGNEDPHLNPRKVPDTTFAILFLSRGRAPVIMNKLAYAEVEVVTPPPPVAPPPPGPTPGGRRRPSEPAAKPAAKPAPKPQPTTAPVVLNDPWNERPGDVAEFTQWTRKQLEGFYTWQILNLKVKNAEFHDAPILYVSGSTPLVFTDEETDKLRQFAEEGGLILGNANCGRPEFAKSFLALGKKMFPKYEFRDLPANHLIYTSQNYRADKWKTAHRLQGLNNGVREVMILIPEDDLGRFWQTRAEQTRADCFQLGFDLYQYAGGGYTLGVRADPYFIEPNPNVQGQRELKVLRLTAGDNPDPEPGGWRRMAALLNNTADVKLVVEEVKLGEGKLKDPKGGRILHWTGTTKFNLSADRQKELANFVEDGGTLIVDAAGGSNEFATSAEAALSAAFGGSPGGFGAILPPGHPVYAMKGAKIDRFEYRRFCRGRLSGKLDAPRLRALEEGGRVQVYYSREDLSAGLVGEQVDGVLGYDPATATAMMRNILLYSAFGPKAMPEAKQ